MDATNLFCNNRACSKYGLVGQENIIWNGAGGDKTPQYFCKVCQRYYRARTGTAFFGLYMDEAMVRPALKALAEALSIRATSGIFDRDKDTIALWLNRAGPHCQAVMAHLFLKLPLRECQLDELWTFIYKEGEECGFFGVVSQGIWG